MDDDRFSRAINAIDAANGDDPNRIVIGGERRPKELAHAQLATDWVTRLVPDPGEPLLLAARAHHLRRWTIPRESHPTGRAGYLRWRRALQEQHAREVAEILTGAGYDEATIARVQDLIRKRGLGSDPDVQVIEDALCLVFIETQLHDLAARVEPEKMVGIVQKTIQKMSPAALAFALELELGSDERALLERVARR